MERTKETTCCFTGHRFLAKDKLVQINGDLRREIENKIEQGYCWFAAGGATGFDTMAARAVLDLKSRFPQIALFLVLPCKDQTNGWSLRDKEAYQQILARADEVEYIAESFLPGCLQARNKRLVDSSSCCIAYLNRPKGGTYFTVNYAESKEIPVVNLAD